MLPKHWLSLTLCLALGALLAGTGCSPSTAPTASAQPAPPTTTAAHVHHRARFEPGSAGGSSQPTNSKEVLETEGTRVAEAQSQILVTILETDRGLPLTPAPTQPTGAAAETGVSAEKTELLHLRVSIVSQQKEVLPLLGPKRFWVEYGDGKTANPVVRGARSPALPTRYLTAGSEVDGWLAFRIPVGASGVALRTNLTTPPSSIPVPAGSSGSRGAVPPGPPARQQ